MPKTPPAILKYLKDQGRGIDLPLDVLRQFQEFEKTLHAALQSYDHLPPAVAYGMRCFTKVEMLSMALIMSGAYPSAQRCHDDIMKAFGKDSAFTDGVTLQSWMLCNFPITPAGDTLAVEVLKRAPDLASELTPCVSALGTSRLGLYEVLGESRDSCQLQELFTGAQVMLNQALGAPRGHIALLRVLELLGKKWALGDTNEFPAERRRTIETMVADKMSRYFPAKEPSTSYEAMMRLAGPYWFSIVARDADCDILDPDHYISYYAEDERR